MGDELSVHDISVTLIDGGVRVSGAGSPDGAAVVAEVQITGGAAGSGNGTVASGQWSATVNIIARPGDSGIATVNATEPLQFPNQTATAFKLFTL